ncbi:unnamed protein product [Withania somnifera]
MLAPFTAGWQSDMGPLVIEKSEVRFLFYFRAPIYRFLGKSQLNTLTFYHSFWNRTTNTSLVLAKELLDKFTANKMSKAFFTNSGSEANDTQVKLVWYYNNSLGRPKKKKFIAQAKANHGSNYITAGLSGLPILHQKFDLPPPFILYTEFPHYWSSHLPGETEEEFSTRLANNLENLILKEGTGVILPTTIYFDKVLSMTFFFIADEVICGFGRLGTMFGCDKYNIKPDLTLSSGYMPIGAVLVSLKISNVILSESNKIGAFCHGFTYSGHPVACAVGLEALKIYKNIIEVVNKISPKFQEGLKAFTDSPIIGEIRGTGLVLSTEFVILFLLNGVCFLFHSVGAYFGAMCEKYGMLVSSSGDHVSMAPPFTLSLEELDELISIYAKALKVTEKRVEELKCQENEKLMKNT